MPFFTIGRLFCIGTVVVLAWSLRNCGCGTNGSAKWGSKRCSESLQTSSNQSAVGAGRLNETEGRPNVLLVTANDRARCDTERGTEFILKSVQNKIDYARLHDLSIYNSLEMLDPKFDNWWIKIVLLKRLMLASPNIEWFLWIDMDVLITDMSMRIPLEKYAGYDLVCHGFNKRIFEERDWLGLNTGVMLLRNTAWSMDLLNALLEMGEMGEVRDGYGWLFNKTLKGRAPFEADDQTATVYLLSHFPEKWAARTYLDEEIHYSTWFKDLVPGLEKIERENIEWRLPFTAHFNGCKFCHGFDWSEFPELCVESFDHFYHYANDQVLKSLGLKHKTPGSPEIVNILDTDTSVAWAV